MMKNSKLNISLIRASIAFTLLSILFVSLSIAGDGINILLVLAISLSVAAFCYLIYNGYQYKDISSPILFSIAGFCFGFTIVIGLAQFYEDLFNILDLCAIPTQ